jgi:hypothetical protein
VIVDSVAARGITAFDPKTVGAGFEWERRPELTEEG